MHIMPFYGRRNHSLQKIVAASHAFLSVFIRYGSFTPEDAGVQILARLANTLSSY